MKIDIQTPGIKARQELLDLITEKVSKLEHLSDRILEARVLLKTEKSDIRDNKICEIRLVIPGNDLFASSQAESFEHAVQDSVNKSKRQVGDWKEGHAKH